MAEFSVWAPNSRRVDLETQGCRFPMNRGQRGWWFVDIPSVKTSADYQFVLDGGDRLPDPRSGWQPRGIHGPSRTVDLQAFEWTDQRWQAGPLSAAVIYELHVGTFTPEGNFLSVIGKLDYLAGLGITHIELMPVAEFSGMRGWGYDGVDLYAPHHGYGTPDDLKCLVDACHARGLAVLIDVVYNHLGPAGNYLGRFAPYFSSRHVTPWGEAVNYDGPQSDEVRRFVCNNALMWLRDYHFDGLRLDAVHALIDTSAIHILRELALDVAHLQAQTGRHLVVIAESDLNDPRVVRSCELGGYGIPAQWSDDFHHSLHTVLTGERDGYYADFGSLAHLAKALRRAFVYDGCYSGFRQRKHGSPPTTLSGDSFLGYLQNHDQIGNRARGERISHLVSLGRQKIGAALVFTAPFIPMLFQGEEWGASAPFLYFTDHEDAELGRLVTEGRRREFAAFGAHAEEVPDPQAQATFDRSKLNWHESHAKAHAELLDWYRRLIRVRREVAGLCDGGLEGIKVQFDEHAEWFVMRRGPVAVVCNFAPSTQAVPITGEQLHIIMASETDVQFTGDEINLPADAVAILLAAGDNASSARF